MDMFADDAARDALEAGLPGAPGVARLDGLVALAWHWRQRDTRRALAFADQAERLLAELGRDAIPRLWLVRAEAKWLFGGLAAAEALADQALLVCTRDGDYAGVADTHYLQAGIARDRGDSGRNDAELGLAAAAAVRAGDGARLQLAEAELIRWDILRDLHAAQARWEGRFALDPAALPLAARASVADYLGLAAHQRSDFAHSVAHWIVAFDAALASGQLRRAITAATNIGDDLSSLNDHEGALEWMRHGLDLARVTGWPVSIGVCLDATAATLRKLGRLDDAYKLQRSALATMAPLAGSRNYAIALRNLGDLALDRKDHQGALDLFRQLQERADALGFADFQTMARRGIADALSRLDRPPEALAAAHDALALARDQNDGYRQIDALRVLAGIHARHGLTCPGLADPGAAPVHYLEQACALAGTIGADSAPLLEELAGAHAAAGDYQRGFALLQQAIDVGKERLRRDAERRSGAERVLREAERMRPPALQGRT